MDGGGGGVDTEQKGSFIFGLGFFLRIFFSSSRDGFYHVTRNNTNVCDIFSFFFRNDGPLVKFLGRKNAHDDDDAQNKTINRHSKSSLFITQATLTMSIAQLGSTTAVSIHFVELDLRVARWMQGSRGCE